MDAQLTGYVRGDLSFQAHADADLQNKAFNYRYGVYVFYNLGYKANAHILGVINWALANREAWTPDQIVKILEKTGSIPLTANTGGRLLLDGPNNNVTSPGGLNNQTMRLTGSQIFKRTDGDDDGPTSPEFTVGLTCPPGSDGDAKIPELRFNCDVLGTVNVGAQFTVKGLCDGYEGITNRVQTLTLSTDQIIIPTRRSKQCRSGFCAQNIADLNAATGGNYKLECDEFPWASAVEGGDYLPVAERSQTCVPQYQNNWGGNCLSN
jgi:hypothetical protein